MEISIEQIKEVIKTLPHSEGRVPYTYHHDYLRLNSKKHKGMSRAEVANEYDFNELELYSLALACIVENISVKVMLDVSQENCAIIKECIKIAEGYVLSYNEPIFIYIFVLSHKSLRIFLFHETKELINEESELESIAIEKTKNELQKLGISRDYEIFFDLNFYSVKH